MDKNMPEINDNSDCKTDETKETTNTFLCDYWYYGGRWVEMMEERQKREPKLIYPY